VAHTRDDGLALSCIGGMCVCVCVCVCVESERTYSIVEIVKKIVLQMIEIGRLELVLLLIHLLGVR
jgi:hypothetical protein